MLGVLYILYVLSSLDSYIITMLVVPIKQDLHLTDFQIGMMLGPAAVIVPVLFALPIGWVVDKYPRRWVVYVGVVVWSIGTAASGLAQNFTSLILARLVVGAGSTGLSPASMSMLADGFPRERLSTAIGIFQSSLKIGSSAAFVVGGLAIGLTGGLIYSIPLLGEMHAWQIILVTIGLPGVLIGLLVFTFAEPGRRTQLVVGGQRWTRGCWLSPPATGVCYCRCSAALS
jgi:MFS family permease